MEWLLLLLLALVVAAAALIKGKAKGAQAYPYRLNTALFTPAERSFLGVLQQAAADEAIVFGKVRVADVIAPVKGLERGEYQKAFNRIRAKHFDYVLCRPDDLSVFSAIELDDSSHQKRNRVERDRFMDGACEAAGLTLHRFKAARGYSVQELRDALLQPVEQALPSLEVDEVSMREADPEVMPSTPALCPKCSSRLVRKVAKKGHHKGKEFLACSGYPNCRYIQPLAGESAEA